MLNLVIFGAPGSGKGTQSEYLTKKYGLFHISTGELLRDHIARGTDLGRTADSFISKGNLIPDSLMIEILADFIDSNPDARRGLILDGFPRTIPQAEELTRLLASRGMNLDAVIGLEVPDEELIDRLIKRGVTSGRADDNLETITKRIEVYHSQTYPLRQFYIDRNLYLPVKATGTVENISNRIVMAIDGRRI